MLFLYKYHTDYSVGNKQYLLIAPNSEKKTIWSVWLYVEKGNAIGAFVAMFTVTLKLNELALFYIQGINLMFYMFIKLIICKANYACIWIIMPNYSKIGHWNV